MTREKVIRDPIHGSIRADLSEIKVLDTEKMQRLRRISQLGFASIVYPGANHTRFEHSLGTFHVAKEIRGTLGLKDRNIEMAALLHDLGHPPLSHKTEFILGRYLKLEHEDKTIDIVKTDLKDLLETEGYDPDRISKYIEGKGGPNGKIVSKHEGIMRTTVDADILDYLLRDSYHTGVAYGVIDKERIIENYRIIDDQLAINEKAKFAVEQLLMGRYIMMSAVYVHRTSSIASSMINRALISAIKSGQDPRMIMEMTDCEFFGMLKRSGKFPKEMTEKVEKRKLLKEVTRLDGNSDWKIIEKLLKLKPDIEKRLEIEAEYAKEFGLSEGGFQIDLEISRPPERKQDEDPTPSILIEKGGDVVPIETVSKIAKSISMMGWDMWYVPIYVSEKKRGVLKKMFLKRDIFREIIDRI